MPLQKLVFLNWKQNIPINYRDFAVLSAANIAFFVPPTVFHELQTVNLGGQNVSEYRSGAFTGEISAEMLKSAGCKYALAGHSERRQLFGETNDCISAKVLRCLEAELIPVLCVGEVISDRESGAYFDVISKQLQSFRAGCIIAYEPVWAIGSGKVPTLLQIEEMVLFIKNYIKNSAKVLYGGSVKPSNTKEICAISSVDGVLVGGASLVLSDAKEMISEAGVAGFQ